MIMQEPMPCDYNFMASLSSACLGLRLLPTAWRLLYGEDYVLHAVFKREQLSDNWRCFDILLLLIMDLKSTHLNGHSAWAQCSLGVGYRQTGSMVEAPTGLGWEIFNSA